MKIYGLKDLDHYTLQIGDVVNFHVKNKHGKYVDFKYVVDSDFLKNITGEYVNYIIFAPLELNYIEFCHKYFGYEYGCGHWPVPTVYHYRGVPEYEAATDAVKSLYSLINLINGSESITKYKKIRTIKHDNNSKLKRI